MGAKKSHHHAVKLTNVLDGKLAEKLASAGVERVGQVRKLSDKELKALPGIGPKAVADIRAEIPA